MEDDESFEDTPLHEAVRFGNIDEVKSLLDEGSDPNKIGFYKWSCLHEAVSIDDCGILKVLLNAGGDPNVFDRCNGSTPLHLAAKQSATQCFKLLIEWGGDINLPNKDLVSPQDCATGQCVEILEQLEMSAVQASSEIDTKNRVLKAGQVRRRKQLQSLGVIRDQNRGRPASPSTSSLHSVTSMKSLDSAITTQSNPVRGPKGQRTSRKPTVNNMYFANKAPGIRISVEYSEHHKELKIRVWSIQYVSLLPHSYSEESSIHVRGCLFPGSKVWSKTEDVMIEKYMPSYDAEKVAGHLSNPSSSVMLQPLPMERKITFKQVHECELSERNIELVLCVKTPQNILANKQSNIGKLFLRCEEAVNLVMPRWFLMTICTAETTKPKKAKKPVQFSNPTFDSSSSRLKSSSVVTISKVEIHEPIKSAPPINNIASSIPNTKNPFRKGTDKISVKDQYKYYKKKSCVNEQYYNSKSLDTRITIPLKGLSSADRNVVRAEANEGGRKVNKLTGSSSSRLLKECV